MTDASRMTSVKWVIVAIAALGFAFDTYELLMLPLIVRPALVELLDVARRPSPADQPVGRHDAVLLPAVCGGIFGLLGGYLTDRLGRRRVLTYSILLYASRPSPPASRSSVHRVAVLALLHLRRRLRGVRRRGRLAGGALRRSEATRGGDRLHAGVRLARRSPGGCGLSLCGHLRASRSREIQGGHSRRGATRCVGRDSGDSADADPAVPAGVAGLDREEEGPAR